MAEAEPAPAADLARALAAIDGAARELALSEEPAGFALALERGAPDVPGAAPGATRP